jgi:hypothetical protein
VGLAKLVTDRRGTTMAIVVHIVNTPNSDARKAYEAAWVRIDEQGLRHPPGRQSHTAWMVGDVFHVLDVWDSAEDMGAFMQKLAPILQESGMQLAGEPEVGELLSVIRPD